MVKAACRALFEPSPLLPSGGDPANLVFFDIETTGLSGGAGTIAFLIGFAGSDGEKLTVDQYFLRDYPGEFDFLGHVLDRIDAAKVYVSYNGKAFDTQILKTRCIMNGRSFPVVGQLDLLYPVRRLWGNVLPSCSLTSVERHVLDIQREADVPGILVPELYFSFLRTGETESLDKVFAHHLQDVVNLERLLAHITGVLSDPARNRGVNRCGLGRWLMDSGFSIGVDVLTEAFEGGDLAAGRYLGRYLKRAGRYEQAASVWRAMYERVRDISAAFELAKYAEHKIRDFGLAEGIVLQILANVKEARSSSVPETAERLDHRLERIRRKAAHHL